MTGIKLYFSSCAFTNYHVYLGIGGRVFISPGLATLESQKPKVPNDALVIAKATQETYGKKLASARRIKAIGFKRAWKPNDLNNPFGRILVLERINIRQLNVFVFNFQSFGSIVE